MKTYFANAFTTLKAAVMNIPAQIKANRAELVRGSVLDEYNHPSYSPEHVAALRHRDSEYTRRHAELRTELGYDW